jgi:hypothetical protein
MYRGRPKSASWRTSHASTLRILDAGYGNSFKLAMFEPGLAYSQGSVLCKFDTLVSHVDNAWCVTEDGKVIDVTLKKVGHSYFGVAFTLEELETFSAFPALDELVDRELAKDVRQ